MVVSEMTSFIALVLFVCAIILLLILRQMSLIRSKVVKYSKGKIPLSTSFYAPEFLLNISKNFIMSHNFVEPLCYVSDSKLFIKVIFENVLFKEDIKRIEIFLNNGNDIDLNSKRIKIYTLENSVYTLYIKTDEINMKKVISKFEEHGYSLTFINY